MFALLFCPSAHASAEKRRVVYLGAERGPGVSEEVQRTLDEAVAAQVGRAAHERGFVEVYLRQVIGLEEEAARCRERECRVSIAKRLGVTHTLRARVARERKGYDVQLYLEDASTGAFLYGVRARGDVPTVRGELIDETSALFEKASPKDAVARERLAKTARAYLAKGRTKDAARTFQRAADVSPFHPDAPKLFLDALSALDAAGDVEEAWRQTEVAVDTWGPSSAWALAGIGDADAVHAALSERVFELGVLDHKHMDKDLEARRRAARAWEAYLRWFPDGEETSKAELYLGEVLFEDGAYVDAAANYESALEGELPDELRALVANNTVVAYRNALSAAMKSGDVTSVELGGEVTFASETTALSSLEEQWVAATDRVATDFAQLEDAPRFAYHVAHLYAARGHADEARRRFADVAQKWPRSRPGKLAKKLVGAKK